jgi:hypothetical protein
MFCVDLLEIHSVFNMKAKKKKNYVMIEMITI